MRQVTQKFGANILAFLVLFSTLSFSVDMHFCGRTLVDLELFEKAQGCGMTMEDGTQSAMGCCSDHEVVVAGQEDLQLPPVFGIALPAVYLPSNQIPTRITLFSGFERKAVNFKNYIPPPLIRDLSVRYQVFLI
jgi:hypothetical protein